MKHQFIFLPLILILLISSCGQSAEEIAILTATASTAIAESWTKTPTLTPTSTHTLTFTPTLTPSPTMTPTITPTPLGGGSGLIACMGCSGGGISVVKPDGTGAIFLADIQNTYRHSPFEWSMDGIKLVYLDIRGTGNQSKFLACVLDTSETSEKKCFEIGGDFEMSPDGSKLVVSNTDGIGIVNIDSGEKQIIVEGAGYSYYTHSPNWSPDGSKIVYVKEGHIYVINEDGSDETRLVSNADTPIWSPDGNQIAYITGWNGQDQRNIILMEVDSTKKLKLTPNLQIYSGKMAWSSDRKYITFLVITGGNARNPKTIDLYTVEVESQKLLRLTTNIEVEDYFISPDGTMIAVTIGIPTETPSGLGFQIKSYIMDMNGAILLEWKNFGSVRAWRPVSNFSEDLLLSFEMKESMKERSWEFESDGDTEGWVTWNQLTPLQVTNGNLQTESTGSDPYMASPGFVLDATTFPIIEIRMKVSSGDLGQIFYITNSDLSYDEAKSVRFKVNGDGEFHTYRIDMSKVFPRRWNGIIRQIRFDPTITQATIEIDYIRITNP